MPAGTRGVATPRRTATARGRVRILEILWFAGALTACSDSTAPADVDLDGIADANDACPEEAEVENGVFDADGCPDTPTDLYEAVRVDVESFWIGAFADAEMSYDALTDFEAYTESESTPCGPTQVNNASYCPANETVYYHEGLLKAYLEQVGDMAPAFIISHEIGHHVSWLLRWLPTLSTKQAELQADCFSGAWTWDAENRGLLEEGDLDEAAIAVISVGDPADTWFDPDLHGTSEQRVHAFVVGYDQGGAACTSEAFFETIP